MDALQWVHGGELEVRQPVEAVNQATYCDPLIGLMNRGHMAETLGEAIMVAGRKGSTCAFLIVSIANLQGVNEAYGFGIADEVIVAVANRLRDMLRNGDAIARYSGSEFGLILNNCSEDALHFAAERFLGMARESVIETARGPVLAMLSIGAVVLPQQTADAMTAMALAEEALSDAKRVPSDGYRVYKHSEERSSERAFNAHSAAEIVRCLRQDGFRLAYQPIVDASTGAAVMHEALLWMADRDGKTIAAASLIPVAEKLGLVRLIDRTVIQMAVAALDRHPDARLAVNVSGTTVTDLRWYPQITEILKSNRSIAQRLTIEITASLALSDLDETLRFVAALRDLGCGVAIDDFGAGFTSFGKLRELPVDMLKLDGNFCRDLAANPDNQYFVRSLIEMARRFGLKSVAERVESDEDAQLLRTWGADFMQGNLFGAASLEAPWTRLVPPPIAEPLQTNPTAAGFDLTDLRRAIEALETAFRKMSAGHVPAEPDFTDLVAPVQSRPTR